MAEKRTAKKTTAKKTTAKKTARKPSGGFTAEERAAMKERAKEAKAERRGPGSKAEGDKEVLAKIRQMKGTDRQMAERVHGIIDDIAPDLVPRLYYGMPAYSKDGKVLCYFRDAAKFKTRYATLGFSDKANLDEGTFWATDFALKELNGDAETKIRALVKKAVS